MHAWWCESTYEPMLLDINVFWGACVYVVLVDQKENKSLKRGAVRGGTAPRHTLPRVTPRVSHWPLDTASI